MPLQFTRRQLLAHSAALPLWPILPLAGLGLTACSSVETTSVQARLLGKSITVISTIGTTLRLRACSHYFSKMRCGSKRPCARRETQPGSPPGKASQ
ncbi:MAG: hypothetical protein U1D36_19300, partial [Hydrogenophaga sp.]